jgi:hypothetical protein
MKLLWFPLESYISYVAPSSNVICISFVVVLSDNVRGVSKFCLIEM